MWCIGSKDGLHLIRVDGAGADAPEKTGAYSSFGGVDEDGGGEDGGGEGGGSSTRDESAGNAEDDSRRGGSESARLRRQFHGQPPRALHLCPTSHLIETSAEPAPLHWSEPAWRGALRCVGRRQGGS